MGAIADAWAIATAAAVAALIVSFTFCAVAELAVRFAAVLYAPRGARRDTQREVWLDAIHQLRPRERPSHAGSIVWSGVAGLARRRAHALGLRLRLNWARLAFVRTVYGGQVLDGQAQWVLGIGTRWIRLRALAQCARLVVQLARVIEGTRALRAKRVGWTAVHARFDEADAHEAAAMIARWRAVDRDFRRHPRNEPA